MINIKETIHSGELVLVNFTAEWCGPCKMLKPVLEDVSRQMKGKVSITKIDIDKNKKTATQYRIQSVPTLILFKNGQIKWRQSGYQSTKQIVSTLQKHIN